MRALSSVTRRSTRILGILVGCSAIVKIANITLEMRNRRPILARNRHCAKRIASGAIDVTIPITDFIGQSSEMKT